MNTFGLNVIASDKQFYRGRGKSISLPAKDGEITIWAHHADMMIAIVPGEIRFQDEDDRWHTAVAGGGFAQVINNRVMVLADSIEKPEEGDIKRAQEAKERAQEQLRQKQSQQEYYISKAALARAMARMKVSGKKDI